MGPKLADSPSSIFYIIQLPLLSIHITKVMLLAHTPQLFAKHYYIAATSIHVQSHRNGMSASAIYCCITRCFQPIFGLALRTFSQSRDLFPHYRFQSDGPSDGRVGLVHCSPKKWMFTVPRSPSYSLRV
jgi:hypothetical protein